MHTPKGSHSKMCKRDEGENMMRTHMEGKEFLI